MFDRQVHLLILFPKMRHQRSVRSLSRKKNVVQQQSKRTADTAAATTSPIVSGSISVRADRRLRSWRRRTERKNESDAIFPQSVSWRVTMIHEGGPLLLVLRAAASLTLGKMCETACVRENETRRLDSVPHFQDSRSQCQLPETSSSARVSMSRVTAVPKIEFDAYETCPHV